MNLGAAFERADLFHLQQADYSYFNEMEVKWAMRFASRFNVRMAQLIVARPVAAD